MEKTAQHWKLKDKMTGRAEFASVHDYWQRKQHPPQRDFEPEHDHSQQQQQLQQQLQDELAQQQEQHLQFPSPQKPLPTLRSDKDWRKHGKLYRAKLILEDEQKGGNSFVLSNQCSIDRYYRVADRVLDQFLSTSSNSSNAQEVAEAYLVGNRLVKFLSVVLPTHNEYLSPDPELQNCRIRSQEQLIDLLQYMEELALIVDEIQYNLYILSDLTPPSKKNLSIDWTESTANDTSWESMSSADSKPLEDRVAAVLVASEKKPAVSPPSPDLSPIRPIKKTVPFYKKKKKSFEADFFDGDNSILENGREINQADSFLSDDDEDVFAGFDTNFENDFDKDFEDAFRSDAIDSFRRRDAKNHFEEVFDGGFGGEDATDEWFSSETPQNASTKNNDYWFQLHQDISFTNSPDRKTKTSRRRRQEGKGSNVPKLQPPRDALPRHLLSQATRVHFSEDPQYIPASFNRSNVTDENDLQAVPLTKIESRLEEAKRLEEKFDEMDLMHQQQLSTMNSNRKLLQHFKGCVKFMVD